MVRAMGGLNRILCVGVWYNMNVWYERWYKYDVDCGLCLLPFTLLCRLVFWLYDYQYDYQYSC